MIRLYYNPSQRLQNDYITSRFGNERQSEFVVQSPLGIKSIFFFTPFEQQLPQLRTKE